MLCNLIIDGNYILSKLTFILYKNNLLYGSLHKSLENTVNNYRKWYPFKNIYLVSDSKEKSWRKKITTEYKLTRKKDSSIDWEFVYNTYAEFKESMSDSIKILESPHIEGDDWISFLADKSNKEGISNIIVSNDYDIKQIVKYSLDPLYLNIMINEMYGKEKIFLPKNYQVFLNKVSNLPNDDIFCLNDTNDFLLLIKKFLNKCNINEIDPVESLIIKIISGDISDNIESVWSQIKNGKKKGIGVIGAKSIYENYKKEFGDPVLTDPDLSDNIADIICEKKKISKTYIPDISKNIINNLKLIDLRIDNLPKQVVNVMSKTFENETNRR